MYFSRKLSLIAGLFLSATPFFSNAQICNYQVPATQQNIVVPAGQKWCISASMSANAEISGNATLRIDKGVTVTLWNINNFNGTIENYGTLNMGGINAGNSNTTIHNLGTLTISNGINANSGIQVINDKDAVLQLSGGANLNSGSVLTNNGTMTVNGNINMNGTVALTNGADALLNINAGMTLNGNGSTLNNSGTLNMNSGDFNTNSATTLNNSGRLTIVSGNFNPAGAVINKGWFDARHFININSGAVITNKCRFIANEGFNNNATFNNDGLVWVTNNGTAKIQNNSGALFTNTANGKIRGGDFDNSGGTVQGSGEFYFTGITKQQGTFTGTDATNPIKFFAVNLAPNANYPGSYFNVGVQGNNVTRPAALNPADTNSYYGFCTEQTFSLPGTPLPLSLTGFNATPDGCTVLLRWTTAQEARFDHFEVEKSADAAAFKQVAIIAGQGAASGYYSYTAAQTEGIGYYRLKMSDRDGNSTYSKVLTVATSCTPANTGWKIYPNPADQGSNVQVMLENADVIKGGRIVITNLMGVTVKNISLVAASQGFPLSGLTAGTYLVNLYNHDGKRVNNTQKLVLR
jgi:hypothetical protein